MLFQKEKYLKINEFYKEKLIKLRSMKKTMNKNLKAKINNK